MATTPETGVSRGRGALMGMAGAFVAAHAVFYGLGGRFDTTSLGVFMQFLDPELLKTRLLESCFYLHVQPPLFNLFLGAVLKLGEPASTIVFQVIYLGLGCLLYTCTYLLQVRLGVGRRVAFVLSTLFMCSPAFLLSEHWLFYTFPCAALLTLSALLLQIFLSTKKTWAIAGFFAVLLVLAGLRTVFHLAFVLVVAGSLIAIVRGHGKQIALAALIPLILIFSLYAKNYLVFGKFTTCTWSGKHLWIKTVANMGWEERGRLFREGKLSPVSNPGINRYERTQFYPEKYWKVGGFEEIPALRQLDKSSMEINYNFIGQIAISEDYGRDARYVLRHYPKTFVLTTIQAWTNYFRSNSTYSKDLPNYAAIQPLATAYDYAIFGRLPFDAYKPFTFLGRQGRPQCLFLLLGLPTVLLCGGYAMVRGHLWRQRFGHAERIVLGYLCFVIFFVAFVGCLFELLETQRFRFMTDPFSVVLLGILLQGLLGMRKSKRRGVGEYE